jgi:hypothetical protein
VPPWVQDGHFPMQYDQHDCFNHIDSRVGASYLLPEEEPGSYETAKAMKPVGLKWCCGPSATAAASPPRGAVSPASGSPRTLP